MLRAGWGVGVVYYNLVLCKALLPLRAIQSGQFNAIQCIAQLLIRCGMPTLLAGEMVEYPCTKVACNTNNTNAIDSITTCGHT